jgi:hypothetical protein
MNRNRKNLLLPFCLLFVCTLGSSILAGEGSLVGGVYVKTNPAGARIYVDGRLSGVSPCGVAEVGIGEVEVEAKKEGYKSSKKRVEVEPDRIATVALELAPLRNRGNIVVLVEPTSAQVSIDRVPFGKTPARITNVQAGTHRVEVGMEGYVPLVKNVTVVAGQDHTVEGTLQEGGDWIGPVMDPFGPGEDEGEEDQGKLDPDAVPLPEEMPEAKALKPVRELLRDRKYEEALEKLNEMANDPAMQDYRSRISRDRRYVRRARNVVQAGYEALKRKIGQEYPVPLEGGINFEGRVTSVTDTHIVLQMGENPKRIELDRIDIERIIKLAASQYSPDKPANQALFAVVYAMAGQFEEANQALQRAARTGYNVTEEKSFVEAERLWKAALARRERQDREKRRQEEMEKKRQEITEGDKRSAVTVLLDRVHGRNLPEEVVSMLQERGVDLLHAREEITDEDLKKASVVIIRDDLGTQSLTKQNASRIVNFVKSGGGLVYFGRTSTLRSPLQPLLDHLPISVQPDSLTVHPQAPERLPDHGALAGPINKRHPVCRGVRPVLFSLRSSSVKASSRSILMVSTKYVRSTETDRSPVPLVAARTSGKGRVVVFGSVPYYGEDEMGKSALRLMINAIAWAGN